MKKITTRTAARTFALGVLAALATTTVSATTAVAQSAQSAQSAQRAGRCELSAVAIRNVDSEWHMENSCTPRLATDRLIQSWYWGADWPDGDDPLFAHNYPPLRDVFRAQGYNLNEDPLAADEVYTENRFRRADGTYYTIYSNEVHKQFFSIAP